MLKTIVLLNPPSAEVHIRDLYCSITSKGNYYWAPIDLLVMSGFLKNEFRLVVIDAIAEACSREETLARILEARPFAVVSLTGSASWREDLKFLEEVKKRHPCLIALSGDVCVETEPWLLKRYKWLDALVRDFTTPEIVSYFASEGRPGCALAGIAYRSASSVIDGKANGAAAASFDYPAPRHDLFPLQRYRLPYARHYPIATVLTNFACPFRCSYCIQNRGVLGYKRRPLENVLEELDALRALGVREIYFRDPLFESRPEQAKALCRTMRERYRFTWSCNSRVDTLREDLLVLMKEAGCRCVAFGFETANEKVLKKYGKPISVEQSLRAIRLCRKHGIRVAGYFILGLPGEDYDSVLRTIDFAVRSGIDYASFAVPSPDYETGLRKEAIAARRISPDFRSFNRSRVSANLSDSLTEKQLRGLLRKAAWRFYGRPSYVAKTLAGVRSLRQLQEIGKAALAVARNYA